MRFSVGVALKRELDSWAALGNMGAVIYTLHWLTMMYRSKSGVVNTSGAEVQSSFGAYQPMTFAAAPVGGVIL
jgi:hypothetical protein